MSADASAPGALAMLTNADVRELEQRLRLAITRMLEVQNALDATRSQLTTALLQLRGVR
jgi:hypothetical protein